MCTTDNNYLREKPAPTSPEEPICKGILIPRQRGVVVDWRTEIDGENTGVGTAIVRCEDVAAHVGFWSVSGEKIWCWGGEGGGEKSEGCKKR